MIICKRKNMTASEQLILGRMNRRQIDQHAKIMKENVLEDVENDPTETEMNTLDYHMDMTCDSIEDHLDYFKSKFASKADNPYVAVAELEIIEMKLDNLRREWA
jgi:hypothetical protein